MARRAYSKLSLSVPTSTWLTSDLAFSCWYSIGSSTVMIRSVRVRLILPMMAASVVDLPEPVVPETMTMPRWKSASSSTCGGRFRSSKLRDLGHDPPHDDRVLLAAVEDVGAEAGDAGQRVGDVDRALVLEDVRRSLRFVLRVDDLRRRTPSSARRSAAGTSRNRARPSTRIIGNASRPAGGCPSR